MKKQLTAEQKLRKMIREELTKDNRLNIRDGWTDSIYVEESWRTPGKFIANAGGGRSISIIDLIDREKLFDTPEAAEKYGMAIVKMWKQFLDKNVIASRK